MKFVYPAIFKQQDGAYTVVFPDLPGCVTQGSTYAEALEYAKEAATGWLELTIRDGDEIPTASNRDDIVCDNGFINDILIDIEQVNE